MLLGMCDFKITNWSLLLSPVACVVLLLSTSMFCWMLKGEEKARNNDEPKQPLIRSNSSAIGFKNLKRGNNDARDHKTCIIF